MVFLTPPLSIRGGREGLQNRGESAGHTWRKRVNNRMGKQSRRKKVQEKPAVGAASAAGPAQPPAFRRLHILILILLCFAVYANTLTMDFVLDDPLQITKNTQIKSLANLPSLFTTNVWSGIKGFQSYYYRPIFTSSLALDYAIWGERPAGFHITNILLHAGATVAVYSLGLLLLRNVTAAFAAGLLFAVHPVHTEAVAWISGRNEMLAAVFMLTSFSFYLRYTEDSRNRSLALSLLLFFLALLSKETAVTLPVVVMLYELICEKGPAGKRMLRPAPLFLLLALYMAIRYKVLGGSVVGEAAQPLLWRIYTAPGMILEYLRLLALPVDLRTFYDVRIRTELISAGVLLPMLALAAVFGGIAILARRDRTTAFLLLFPIVCLAPVIGILKFIFPALMAERYLYIPLAGFALALGLLYSRLLGITSQKEHYVHLLAKAGGVAVAGALFLGSFNHNTNWRNDLALSTSMVRDAPGSYFTHFFRGLTFESMQKLDPAAAELETAVRLNPDHAESHNSLGIVYDQMGRQEEALGEYRKVLELRPDDIKALNNLGILYEKTGQYDGAVNAYQKAISLDPGNTIARTNLGLLYRKLNRPDDAEALLRAAVASDREDPVLHNNLGTMHYSRQRYEEAEEEFRIALKLDPGYVEAHNNLGLVYRRQNLPDKAIGEFQAALNINPGYAEAHNNLGVAYAVQKRFDEAIVHFEKAVRLEPRNEGFQRNLKKAKEDSRGKK